MKIHLENRNPIQIFAHQHEYQLCVAGGGVFVGHDDAVFEDLTTPDTPGLPPMQGSGQTLGLDRAVAAKTFCPL